MSIIDKKVFVANSNLTGKTEKKKESEKIMK